MTQLHAQPYDISATGFYFETVEEYKTKANDLRNDYGDPVEEFEIQFIDGEHIDCDLAEAFAMNQANIGRFFELVDEWDEHEKIRFIIAVGECGYSFDVEKDDICLLDVDLYEEDNMKDLAIRFVDDGLFGDITKSLEFYIDYEAIARDLAVEYSLVSIAGENFIYRCA